MSEYERFTEKVDSGFVSELDCRIAYNKLSAIEDKIELGTLKDIPVNVGDTLYIPWVWNGTNGIAEIQVRYIFINETGIFFDGDMETDDYGFLDEYGGQYHIEEIGKKLFLTNEEAEKRLKELQE